MLGDVKEPGKAERPEVSNAPTSQTKDATKKEDLHLTGVEATKPTDDKLHG